MHLVNNWLLASRQPHKVTSGWRWWSKVIHAWCKLVHLHIVFVLLYSACCSVNILSCVDVIQSFMHLLHVIILCIIKRCVWERERQWEVAYFQPATSIDCLHLLFWWYLWEAVGPVSHFLLRSHTTSFSYVQNNNVQKICQRLNDIHTRKNIDRVTYSVQ